ncbi:S28 family serine protease [Archangium lipolyticum]|uniref:S28 family serine protease n=1 Tax=Archangium lipolyticum TaxID=2970465 RepID=UPI002149A90F|nr:S28 family serine protease [Archangium lipolyticum]
MRRLSMGPWLRPLMGLLGVALLPACEKTPPPGPEIPVCSEPGIPGMELQTQVRPGPVSTQATVDIRTQLESIPGLTILDEEQVDGFRFFTLDFEQPADHSNPQGERFLQRMTLFHSSGDAPMVMDTEGQAIFAEPIAAEPVYLLGANQITVEHRFYGTSRPASGDWKLLTIEQASADFHRVVETFKPIYGARWLSTGVFKGGTAAILHRFLYPDDVYATVPYALQHSLGLEDEAPGRALAQVGDEACRQRLAGLQRAALERREELLPFVDAMAGEGVRFDVLGRDRAFEFAVVEMPFNFWQRYGLAEWNCDSLPAPTAPARELFDFVSYVGDLAYLFSDDGLELNAPLRYQYATQFGSPRYPEEHLRPLLRHPGEHEVTRFPPQGVEKRFDRQLMERVEAWMRNDAQRMLLVHGSLDPWTASTFDVNVCKGAYRLVVPDSIGFYGVLGELNEPARGFVFGKLSEWAGVPVREQSSNPFQRRQLESRWRAKAERWPRLRTAR